MVFSLASEAYMGKQKVIAVSDAALVCYDQNKSDKTVNIFICGCTTIYIITGLKDNNYRQIKSEHETNF